RRAQYAATGASDCCCLLASASLISARRRSMRSSTVIDLQMSALTQAVISASRVRASLPAISTPLSSRGQPAARCSRHKRASCIGYATLPCCSLSCMNGRPSYHGRGQLAPLVCARGRLLVVGASLHGRRRTIANPLIGRRFFCATSLLL